MKIKGPRTTLPVARGHSEGKAIAILSTHIDKGSREDIVRLIRAARANAVYLGRWKLAEMLQQTLHRHGYARDQLTARRSA